ncbi:unnamed protein product [Pleuronectes platessa]|uniref:Uncharacterized protein n=1 Tax=Pleuronectes platessa TaxID=8262 RepID=A0A9N7U506_PLEPL|nr:unnamed protein product [Pleuronectes platessa]
MRAARKALRGASERHGEGVPRWRGRSYLSVSVKTQKHTLALTAGGYISYYKPTPDSDGARSKCSVGYKTACSSSGFTFYTEADRTYACCHGGLNPGLSVEASLESRLKEAEVTAVCDRVRAPGWRAARLEAKVGTRSCVLAQQATDGVPTTRPGPGAVRAAAAGAV